MAILRFAGVGNQKLSLLLVYMPSGLCKLCVNFVFYTVRKSKMRPGQMEMAISNLTSPSVYLIPGGPGTHFSGLNKLFYKCRFFRFFRPTGVNPLLWRFVALEPVPPECIYCASCIHWRMASPTPCLLPHESSKKSFCGGCRTPQPIDLG